MNTISKILKNKNGLRVIGDVHAHFTDLKHVVDDAKNIGYAILSLGDIIDRGDHAVECMNLINDIIHNGDGIIVPGNHDVKLYRYFIGNNVNIGDDLNDTLCQIKSHKYGEEILKEFVRNISDRELWLMSENKKYFFVHAGFDSNMIGNYVKADGSSSLSGKEKKRLHARAIYGQTDGTTDERGYPNRIYDWFDTVSNMSVFIGHDVLDLKYIVTKNNTIGGKLYHIDTGVDRGGKLSFYDINKNDLLDKGVET